MSRNLICEVIAIAIFIVAFILGFALLGSSAPDVAKEVAVVALGLAFHAAAHIP